jgi:hypothetical protein
MNDFVLFANGYDTEGQVHLYSLKDENIQSLNLINREGKKIII